MRAQNERISAPDARGAFRSSSATKGRGDGKETTKPLSVRFTDRERAFLRRKAQGKPIGTHIRDVVLADAPKKTHVAKADPQKLALVLSMLGKSRLSQNLNQLAKAVNTGTLDPTPEVEEQIITACAAVMAMRATLLEALGLKPERKKMILHGNQRGGARNLALHLLNAEDNEHIDVHEVSGFVADTLPEAFQEAYAISRATKCKQFLFSVSLSPPKNAKVSTEAFESAAQRIEDDLKLTDQPRAIVFHEKNGRRHAHCVWSRIDAENLKAINLPFYKSKLTDLSRELYLEHGWKMPMGLIDREQRNPLNFTLEQWQQAKRLKDDPRRIKTTLRQCWATSDSRKAFEAALEQKGYYLARGDRRGYVAVDWRGEVYSLSRWTGVKSKDLKPRLGSAKDLRSVDDTKATIDKKTIERFETLTKQINAKHDRESQVLEMMRPENGGKAPAGTRRLEPGAEGPQGKRSTICTISTPDRAAWLVGSDDGKTRVDPR